MSHVPTKLTKLHQQAPSYFLQENVQACIRQVDSIFLEIFQVGNLDPAMINHKSEAAFVDTSTNLPIDLTTGLVYLIEALSSTPT